MWTAIISLAVAGISAGIQGGAKKAAVGRENELRAAEQQFHDESQLMADKRNEQQLSRAKTAQDRRMKFAEQDMQTAKDDFEMGAGQDFLSGLKSGVSNKFNKAQRSINRSAGIL